MCERCRVFSWPIVLRVSSFRQEKWHADRVLHTKIRSKTPGKRKKDTVSLRKFTIGDGTRIHTTPITTENDHWQTPNSHDTKFAGLKDNSQARSPIKDEDTHCRNRTLYPSKKNCSISKNVRYRANTPGAIAVFSGTKTSVSEKHRRKILLES